MRHLLPMGPVWLASIIIVLFAALPDKVPAALKTTTGLLFLAGVTVGAAYVEPVLGAACAIFLADLLMSAPTEAFEPSILTADYVTRKNRWHGERALGENIRGINFLSDDWLNKDYVQNKNRWADERIQHIHPKAIDMRPVSNPPMYEESGHSRK
jgi:hypothetical protein